jgi:hypothetical protein
MMAMLSAIGVCHRSSAAFAARYQLVRSVKIEQTSPGFAGGALLQPLNTINTPQQAFRNLHDSARELIGKEPDLRDEPASAEVFRSSSLTACRPAGLNRSKPARLNFSLIGCWPFTSVFPVAFPVVFPVVFPAASCSLGATQSCRAKPCAHNRTAFSPINDLDSGLALKIPLHR